VIVDGLRFEFRERGVPPEIGYTKTHAQSHPSSTTSRDCIGQAKQKSNPLRGSDAVGDNPPGSFSSSISASTATYAMADGRVASKKPRTPEQPLHFPPFPHKDLPHTTAASNFKHGGRKSLQASPGTIDGPRTESHETIRPTLPSIWNSPFAPRPGETEFPASRPGTVHQQTGFPSSSTTPNAPSSNTRFQEALIQQQRDLEMQPSSVYDFPTTSLSQPASSAKITNFIGRDLSPIPSPFASSPSVPSATFPSYDIPRQVPQQPRFGAIGQIPPSGQGG
jgi:hypothetical protein